MTWSPAASESCQAPIASLDELKTIAPSFERNGRAFVAYTGSLFRSTELRNYEIDRLPPGAQPVANVPADVLRALGWKSEPRTAGAYPRTTIRE